jgi:hypothetical protein
MNTQATTPLKTLSPTDWRSFGLNQVAYLKPLVVNGQAVFAIYAADGSQLALVATREIGFGAMYEHDLEPVALH